MKVMGIIFANDGTIGALTKVLIPMAAPGIVTALIFFVQKFANSKFNFTMNAMHSIETHKPGKASGIFMHVYCYFIVLVAMMPQFFVDCCTNRSNTFWANGISTVKNTRSAPNASFRARIPRFW